jgi:hypothetical protein
VPYLVEGVEGLIGLEEVMRDSLDDYLNGRLSTQHTRRASYAIHRPAKDRITLAN